MKFYFYKWIYFLILLIIGWGPVKADGDCTNPITISAGDCISVDPSVDNDGTGCSINCSGHDDGSDIYFEIQNYDASKCTEFIIESTGNNGSIEAVYSDGTDCGSCGSAAGGFKYGELQYNCCEDCIVEAGAFDAGDATSFSPSMGLDLNRETSDPQLGSDGTRYMYLELGDNGTFDICMKEYSTPQGAADDACGGASGVSEGSWSSEDNVGVCEYTGESNDAGGDNNFNAIDPDDGYNCEGSYENTAWYSYTASSDNDIQVYFDNFKCADGGCGYQMGIFSAGVSNGCSGLNKSTGCTADGGTDECYTKASIGCHSENNCGGGASGSTRSDSRLTWTDTSATSAYATITNVSSNEDFYFVVDGNADAECMYDICINEMDGNGNSCVLPIEMIDFYGEETTAGIRLNWSTAVETKNKRFEVQHSTDKKAFKTLGFKKGAGTSSTSNDYSYLHKNPPSGVNYYRIKDVSTSGNADYSKVIGVDYGASKRLQIDNVNATSNSVSIDIKSKEPVRVTLYNTSGQKVYEKTDHSSNQLHINTTQWQKGMYILQIRNQYTVVTKQITLF